MTVIRRKPPPDSQSYSDNCPDRDALPPPQKQDGHEGQRKQHDERDKLDRVAGRVGQREVGVGKFVDAYRHYCWPVNSLTDLKLAPFHLLASEGKVHTDRTHVWHMDTLAAVCRADSELLLATAYKVVDVTDPAGVAEGTEWWTALTGRGGEGMVVRSSGMTAARSSPAWAV